MLLKPDKLPSLTTSYRPISLMSSIMKLLEWVIEQRLRSYLEDIGFINKYQSGFRQNKSTEDHLFRLSQSVMESFNRRERVVAAFLDVEKAFDNVWHNVLRYKIFNAWPPHQNDTLALWLSSWPSYSSQREWFSFWPSQPHCRGTTGFCPESITFPDICQWLTKTSPQTKLQIQFADDTALWAASRNVHIAAKLLQKDLRKLAKWCAKWRIKLNPEETKVILFSRSYLALKPEPTLKLYGERLKIYPQVKFLGITFDSKFTFKKHFEDILGHCNTRYHCIRLLTNKKWGPSPSTMLQIYKQCVRPIFEYGSLSRP